MEEFGQDFIQGMKNKLDIELIGVVTANLTFFLCSLLSGYFSIAKWTT